ncbi:unnamed protein product [Lepidochelys olivacea]
MAGLSGGVTSQELSLTPEVSSQSQQSLSGEQGEEIPAMWPSGEPPTHGKSASAR